MASNKYHIIVFWSKWFPRSYSLSCDSVGELHHINTQCIRLIYTGKRAHTRARTLPSPPPSLSVSLSLRSPLLHHSCFTRVWYLMWYTGCNHPNGSRRPWTMILFRFFHSHHGNIAPASTQSMSTRVFFASCDCWRIFLHVERLKRHWEHVQCRWNMSYVPFQGKRTDRFLLHPRVPPSASSCARVPLMLLLMQVVDCCHFITPSQAVSVC